MGRRGRKSRTGGMVDQRLPRAHARTRARSACVKRVNFGAFPGGLCVGSPRGGKPARNARMTSSEIDPSRPELRQGGEMGMKKRPGGGLPRAQFKSFITVTIAQATRLVKKDQAFCRTFPTARRSPRRRGGPLRAEKAIQEGAMGARKGRGEDGRGGRWGSSADPPARPRRPLAPHATSDEDRVGGGGGGQHQRAEERRGDP